MTLVDLAQILEDHYSPKARDIKRFAGTGYSFEDWFNWEQFSAFTARAFECSPKPSYKTHFTGHALVQLGDIAIGAKDGTTSLVDDEVASSSSPGRCSPSGGRSALPKWDTRCMTHRR